MPKNTGMGGNKRKKEKKAPQESKKELEFKGEMEEDGHVTRLLGDARMEIQCFDGIKRIGHIRGKMRKRNWIANGDIVLVSLREYEQEKCDIINKYTEDEVRKLKKANEIPESAKLPNENDEDEKDKKNDNYNDIVFEEDEPVKEENRTKNKNTNKDDEEEEDEKEVDIDDI